MPFEDATWIQQLNADNPLASERISVIDEHARSVKKTLLESFVPISAIGDLPNPASLPVGAIKTVAETGTPYSIMVFAVTAEAEGSRNWKCIAGGTGDLIHLNYNFADPFRMYQVGSATQVWNFNFPYFLIRMGAPTSGGDDPLNDFLWIDSNAIRDISVSLTGTSQAHTATNAYTMEVPAAGTGNTPIVRTLFLGRSAITNNTARIYIGTRDASEDVWPISIRGHS